jgi:hypothetical protein
VLRTAVAPVCPCALRTEPSGNRAESKGNDLHHQSSNGANSVHQPRRSSSHDSLFASIRTCFSLSV